MRTPTRFMGLLAVMFLLHCANAPEPNNEHDARSSSDQEIVQGDTSSPSEDLDPVDLTARSDAHSADSAMDTETAPLNDLIGLIDAADSDLGVPDLTKTDATPDDTSDIQATEDVTPDTADAPECGPSGAATDPLSVAPKSFASVSTYIGSGALGNSDGPLEVAEINWPASITFGPQGEVYLVDSGNHTIRQEIDGQLITIAGTGIPGNTDGPALEAQFDEPIDLVVGLDGTLYVSDYKNHSIRTIKDGVVSTLTGTGVDGSANGPYQNAEFAFPMGIDIDDCGALYVADSKNHAIRKVYDGQVTTVAGSGVPGYADGPAANAQFKLPLDVAVDPAGTIYVSDATNHRIRVISDNVVSTLVGSQQGWQDGPWDHVLFGEPWGLDLDQDGRLYISDKMTHKIRMVANNEVQTIAGYGGQEGNFTAPPTWGGYTDGPAELAQFNWPLGLAVHPTTGDIWVVDSGNQRIRIISQSIQP